MKNFPPSITVSVLYREPKLLKDELAKTVNELQQVSVLYREPKLLKGKGLLNPFKRRIEFQCSTVSRNC